MSEINPIPKYRQFKEEKSKEITSKIETLFKSIDDMHLFAPDIKLLKKEVINKLKIL